LSRDLISRLTDLVRGGADKWAPVGFLVLAPGKGGAIMAAMRFLAMLEMDAGAIYS